jgi:sigma-B regulation protein RsbU (phosphoserine phosphatase)
LVSVVTLIEGDVLPLCTAGAAVPPGILHPAVIVSLNGASNGITELADAGSDTPRLIVPLRAGHTCPMALVIGPARNKGALYTAADHLLVTEAVAHVSSLLMSRLLAARIGASVSRARRRQAEAECARRVQQHLLPGLGATVEGIDYDGESRAAGDLGGDFFDFIPKPGGRLVLSVGDVSGTGIPAAILMTGIQATLRTLTTHGDGSLADIVGELNRMVWGVWPDNFCATLFYASIDTESRQITYVNAGHEPAILVSPRAGRIVRLDTGGTVLGLSTRSPYRQGRVRVEPGDCLVAFTDGITEATDGDGREFLESGVLKVLREHPDARASDIVHLLLGAVDQHAAESHGANDRTAAVMRFTGTSEVWQDSGTHHEAATAYAIAV